MNEPFNRTTVELKRCLHRSQSWRSRAFNRTTVELKLNNADIFCLPCGNF